MGFAARRLRRRRMARVAVPLAVLGVLAMVALPGASAAVSQTGAATPTAPASASPTPAPPPGKTTCTTVGSGATCTGTYGGDTAWDPSTKAMNPKQPTVTVSQSRNLVNQSVQVSWANFTPGRLGGGAPVPSGSQPSAYNVGVFECRGTNPQSPVLVHTGTNGFGSGNPHSTDCYDIADQRLATAGAANAQVLPTGPDGTGQGTFHIEASSQVNNFLNCDVNSPCSLAVVPNWGGQEPGLTLAGNLPQACGNHAEDFSGFRKEYSAFTDYIGAPCSWADRIVVPLTFEPAPGNCPAKAPAFQSEGSPMLGRALSQWLPGWCTGPGALSFGYDSIDEYQARNTFLNSSGALTARVDTAMVTRPPDATATQASSRKFTYAPLATSGIAIAYYIDDPLTHKPISHLVLDARLVAKLLTQSYSLSYDCRVDPATLGRSWQPPPPAPSSTCDPAVSLNPSTIFSDPEFLALNQHCDTSSPSHVCTRADFPADAADNANMGTFLPTVVLGNSDTTYELTRWIASDPTAEAFLQGTPDPWGMHVNSNYNPKLGALPYPIDQFTPRDQGWSDPLNMIGYGGPDGTMQMTWNPVQGLDNAATDQVIYKTQADYFQLACPIGADGNPLPSCANGGKVGLQFPSLGYAAVGTRDLFAVVAQGDAAAYQFPSAELVNPAGKAVAPTTSSMTAALHDMSTNPDKITQYANDTSTDPNAYPLTMVDYAMVPTCGLPKSEASAISGFLGRASTTGQVPGLAPGNLFPGYVPLDSAQRAQTKAAAAAVAAQTCQSPPPDTTVSGRKTNDVNPPNVPGGSPGTGPGPGPGPGAAVGGPGAKSTAAAGAHATGPKNTPGPAASGQALAYGTKDGGPSGLMGWLFPLALSLGALLVLVGPAAYVIHVTGTWPVIYRRVRGIGGQITGLVGRA
jgi:hypothetical protein